MTFYEGINYDFQGGLYVLAYPGTFCNLTRVDWIP